MQMKKETMTDAVVVILFGLIIILLSILGNEIKEENNPKCSDYNGVNYNNGVVVFDTTSNILKIKCEGEFYVKRSFDE